jgi:hypothetical protein
MKPVTEQSQIDHYLALVREMTATDTEKPTGFKPEWVHAHGWKVVPVEDSGHLVDEEIAVLVPALNRAGFTECLAVATEWLDPAPACYQLPISEDGLRAFNQECGLFRYLLTDESRTWAISCDVWYNLFAGPPELLAAMLGKPIEEARGEFLEYASILAGGTSPDESILQVAKHYAAL